MKKIILILLLLNLNNHVYSIEPDVFVQSTVNRASSILSENISKDQKILKLKKIAKETVDIRGIGFYTLGPIRKKFDIFEKISTIWIKKSFEFELLFARMWPGRKIETLSYPSNLILSSTRPLVFK